MSILKRLEKLEKLERMDGREKSDLCVFIVPCPTDGPITCSTYGDVKIYKRDDETLDEFESRCASEVRHLPNPTGIRVFSLWMS